MKGASKSVMAAIARLWPDGRIAPAVDYEGSWFVESRPKLTRELKSIEDAQLLFEREAEGEPLWGPDSNPEEDPPDDCVPSRSYHLYFVAPVGEAFEYTTESDSFSDAGMDGEAQSEVVRGAGRMGLCVAVSLLAPFGVITFGDWAQYDDGSVTEPEIELAIQDINGDLLDLEQHFLELAGEVAFTRLQSLRDEIAQRLESYGVTVLPAQEWRKPVSGPSAGDEMMFDSPLRVLDTLFFETLD